MVGLYSPSTLAVESTIGIFQGTKSLHIAGNANDGTYQGTLNIDTLEADCSTDINNGWTDKYQAVGQVFVVSGTPHLQIIDGDGSTEEISMNIGTPGGTTPNHWETFHTSYFTTTYSAGCGNGEIRFYCETGDCEFYVDNIQL